MMNDGGRGSNSGGVGADQTFAAHGYNPLYLRAIFLKKLSLYIQAQKAYRRTRRLIEAFSLKAGKSIHLRGRMALWTFY